MLEREARKPEEKKGKIFQEGKGDWSRTAGAFEAALLWSITEIKILALWKKCASNPDFVDDIFEQKVRPRVATLKDFLEHYKNHREYWNEHDSFSGSVRTVDDSDPLMSDREKFRCEIKKLRNCGMTPSGTWPWSPWNPPPSCPIVPCAAHDWAANMASNFAYCETKKGDFHHKIGECKSAFKR